MKHAKDAASSSHGYHNVFDGCHIPKVRPGKDPAWSQD
jgi:hypothetical protein